MKPRIIGAPFFRRDPLTCARELIGTKLNWGQCSGIVVEVEAYTAQNDEASHTFVRPSARDFVQRNAAGTTYVYFSYGTHWMFNVLIKGAADGFVLIRALEPRQGLSAMRKRRGLDDIRELCSGPGKLTRALDITKRHHEMSLVADPRYSFSQDPGAVAEVVADQRIGITKSADFPWRFTLRGSPFVSRRAKDLEGHAPSCPKY
jgi:DNA-3-methyladenine glycosylase